ncbi:MAG: glycosyltransferase family 2 protein, partial [Sciscionella sp.]
MSAASGGEAHEVPVPRVSVVLVNYREAEHTIACLRALRSDLDYSANRLQLICVDNASGDGSVPRIKRAVPGVQIIESAVNTGFAGGCNLGAQHATGDVLAFLNNDARPHPGWVRAAVLALRADPTVGVIASKVLDWDGEKIDFVDAGLTWFGMGYSRGAGTPDDPSHDIARDTLFATGAAMFVRAGVFRELEGFDERFFMFYEDVDFGWRANLRGWRVRFVPESIAYHRHHASMSQVDGADGARETYLLERNALAALYKNFSDETLARALPAALALTVRRATARGELDPRQLDITPRTGDEPATVEMPRTALAGMLAIDQLVDMLPALADSRAQIQSSRTRTDADLRPLMRKAIEPAYPLPGYLAAHQILLDVFGIDEIFGRPRKVLIVTGDAITDQMAGPAIRAWHTAEVLAVEHDVRLVTVNPRCEPPES